MNERIAARLAELRAERDQTIARLQQAQREVQQLTLLAAGYDAAVGELEALLAGAAPPDPES